LSLSRTDYRVSLEGDIILIVYHLFHILIITVFITFYLCLYLLEGVNGLSTMNGQRTVFISFYLCLYLAFKNLFEIIGQIGVDGGLNKAAITNIRNHLFS
jgi:hypothetical protein